MATNTTDCLRTLPCLESEKFASIWAKTFALAALVPDSARRSSPKKLTFILFTSARWSEAIKLYPSRRYGKFPNHCGHLSPNCSPACKCGDSTPERSATITLLGKRWRVAALQIQWVRLEVAVQAGVPALEFSLQAVRARAGQAEAGTPTAVPATSNRVPPHAGAIRSEGHRVGRRRLWSAGTGHRFFAAGLVAPLVWRPVAKREGGDKSPHSKFTTARLTLTSNRTPFRRLH